MRACGECNVCCVYPEIPAIKKPAGERCNFLCDDGCSIYVDRPAPCRAYSCAWLEGHGKPDDRPDRCGVLVDVRDTDNFGTVLVARSATTGSSAISTKAGKRAVKRIARSAGMRCLVTADDDNQRVVRSVG